MRDLPLSISTERFAEHLRTHANRYLGEPAEVPPDVRLLWAEARSASTLYEFCVRTGSQDHRVLVKAISTRGKRSSSGDSRVEGADRPRLLSPIDPAVKSRLEYEALGAMQTHFEQLKEPRFGMVRVFDHLPEEHAVIMEAVRQPSLRTAFVKSKRPGFSADSATLNVVFQNAGAWLRAYHALPKRNSVQHRHTRRTDFLRFIEEVTHFLGLRLDDPRFFDQVAASVAATACDILPEELPLGLAHGDFAMRNILIGPKERVTVIDTLARHRTAIYEDLGYFLLALKIHWCRAFDRLLPLRIDTTSEYEHAFLSGYFVGDSIPRAALRLYEVQALLDKWASFVVHPTHTASWSSQAVSAARLQLMSRLFRNVLWPIVSNGSL